MDNTVVLVPLSKEEIQFLSITMVDRMLDLHKNPSKSTDTKYDFDMLNSICGKLTDRLKAIGVTPKK